MGRTLNSRNGQKARLICAFCNVEKEVSSTHRKFCSHKCFTENRKKITQATKLCLFCKKEFIARKKSGSNYPEKKYCDYVCASRGKIRKRGYSLSAEHRRKIGESQRGHLANNWRGGVYKEEDAQRRRASYKQWRKNVFERDGYTCVLCGKRGGELNADHIKSFALYPDLRTDVSNGRTLCVPCHKSTSTYGTNVKYMK